MLRRPNARSRSQPRDPAFIARGSRIICALRQCSTGRSWARLGLLASDSRLPISQLEESYRRRSTCSYPSTSSRKSVAGTWDSRNCRLGRTRSQSKTRFWPDGSRKRLASQFRWRSQRQLSARHGLVQRITRRGASDVTTVVPASLGFCCDSRCWRQVRLLSAFARRRPCNGRYNTGALERCQPHKSGSPVCQDGPSASSNE
jgi:hypothetical protein